MVKGFPMKFRCVIFWGAFMMAVVGCEQKPGLTGRDSSGGGTAPTSPNPEKPTDPNSDAKKVEKMGLLQFQPPTQVPEEFLNVQRLVFSDEDQAWFSFIYDAKTDGSFFFLTNQVTLKLDCKSSSETYKYDVVWQEIQETKRIALEHFKPNVTEYIFKSNKRYVLSYVLQDLKKDFPGCKSATLKFATFQKQF
jgi:hypothetical protein